MRRFAAAAPPPITHPRQICVRARGSHRSIICRKALTRSRVCGCSHAVDTFRVMRGRTVIAAALATAGLGAGGWALVAPGADASPLAKAPGCPVFPKTNVWNKRVDALPVAANSAAIIAHIPNAGVHPDFGSWQGYGIPINVVPGTQTRKRVRFTYADQSDHVGYPIPKHPRIERGSDRHVLIVDRGHCRLYELFAARKTASGWHAGSGATRSLRSNHLRPAGWTSADAAGLPILPGLVRWNEVRKGVIDHALRFTVPVTCTAYVYPARHQAGSTGDRANYPRMGERLRLKSSVDISGLPRQARVIAVAMRRYGIIVADNGTEWYVQGASNAHFNDDALHELDRLTGSDFVVVDTSTLRNG
jgi:hypothetical protein